jgi:hypothetical protein
LEINGIQSSMIMGAGHQMDGGADPSDTADGSFANTDFDEHP